MNDLEKAQNAAQNAAPAQPKIGNQIRKNSGKPRLVALVPLGALEAIARAGEVGLVKYKLDSFRENGGYTLSECLDSAVRHIYARAGGQKYDPEGSKLLGKPVDHLDQAIWNLAAACESLRLYGDVNDDCWKGLKALEETCEKK